MEGMGGGAEEGYKWKGRGELKKDTNGKVWGGLELKKEYKWQGKVG